jgi:hypothetical protein
MVQQGATMNTLTVEQRAMAEANLLSKHVWSARRRERTIAFAAAYDDVIAKCLADPRFQLPAFPGTQNIGVFSDYGGEHAESPVLTYSFLIVDYGWLEGFGQAMDRIRSEHGLGSREISFKELGSGAITAAVPKIVREADMLPGLLFTLVVNKRLKSIIGADEALADARLQLDRANITSWQKPRELEGAVRKVHTVAYWLAMLAREGMGVLWMTDRDNFVCNPAAVNDVRKLLPGALDSVQAPKFRLIGFAQEFKKEATQPYLNDCLAIADLCAGSIAAACTEMVTASPHSEKKIAAISDVLALHAHQGVFLKKLIIDIDAAEDGQLATNVLWIENKTRPRDGYFPYEREVAGLEK